MRKRKGKTWTATEKKILIENYATKTIQELMELLPKRSQESINNKIERLKAAGKLLGGKEEETIQRAYHLRDKKIK